MTKTYPLYIKEALYILHISAIDFFDICVDTCILMTVKWNSHLWKVGFFKIVKSIN